VIGHDAAGAAPDAGGDPYRELAKDLMERTEGLCLVVALRLPQSYERHPGIVTVNTIALPETRRGQGVGSGVLAVLCALADVHGHWMALTPVLDLGATSLQRLTRFYARSGFLANRGRRLPWTAHALVRPPTHGG
jgi:predicted GNAT family N-acyltransferase